MLTIYQYPQCGTCKKALKWLDEHEIEYKSIDIVERPPSLSTLKKVKKQADLPVNKLFNTSGQLYRQGGYKQKLETMSEAEALEELASHGKLIKRPIVVGDGVALVGFKPAEYEKALR